MSPVNITDIRADERTILFTRQPYEKHKLRNNDNNTIKELKNLTQRNANVRHPHRCYPLCSGFVGKYINEGKKIQIL